MFDEWANQDFSGLSSEAMVREPVWQDRYDFAIPGQGSGTPELPMLDEGRAAEPAIDTGFLTYDGFHDSVAKTWDLEPLSTEGDPFTGLPDGGTVDDIVVTGVPRSPQTGLPGIIMVGHPPIVSVDPVFDAGSTITRGLCELSNLVRGLDGSFFGETDGDGIDELLNILSVASFALGVGGLAGLFARFSSGALNSSAFLGAVSFWFGDDIALRISYIAFGRVAVAGTASAVVTDNFKNLLEALTNGNPPPICPGR